MKLLSAASLACALALVGSVQPSDLLGGQGLLEDLQSQTIDALRAAGSVHTDEAAQRHCSIQNAVVRKDWDVMSRNERKAYTSAVQCLIKAPSQSDPVQVPGARTRYDDFVAQHINQTLSIHVTGNFLSWHRYFVWGYEEALREECGYKGYQPYWNWFKYQTNMKESPVFDGSDTSMGGDGYYVPHNGSFAGPNGTMALPSGEGGGCIKSGPFKNLQLNLGPLAPSMAGEVPVTSPFAYNPRCAKRDLTNYASQTWFTHTNLYNITLGPASHSIALFQNELQGRFEEDFLGMHAAGHFVMNGDGGDFFSSPNDPAFWLHHAMVDRVWWIWQALHLDQAETIAGTITINNDPPSRNATLEDLVQMNYLGLEDVKIGKLLNTLGGEPFCYIYL